MAAIKIDAKVVFSGVIKALEEIAPGVTEELTKVKFDNIKRLETLVRSIAPKRTGKYSNSITGDFLSAYPRAVAKSQKGAPKATGSRLPVAGAGGADPNGVGLFAPYIWAWLEFGTVKTRRRPHIYPAYRSLRPKLRSAMTRAVNKAVKKAIADGNRKTASEVKQVERA